MSDWRASNRGPKRIGDRITPERIAAFWKRVDRREDGCWIWAGGRFPEGYGAIQLGQNPGGLFRAHRVAYYLKHGAFDPRLMVCHRCDVPACVNPDHLFLGTAKDNWNDMMEKHRKEFARGEENGASKLSAEQAAFVIRSRESPRVLADMLSVTVDNIYAIKKGRSWKHLPRGDAPRSL